MRARLRWFVFAAAMLSCIGLGYASYSLAGRSWNAVVSYHSPYSEVALPASDHGSAEASRTVLVIIDGLRADAAGSMGTLDALRAHGTDLELDAPQPSLSYPNWTTLLSGAPPYISGVVTNWHEGAAPVETLFDTAVRAGVRTAFVGPDDFEQLYGVREKCAATFMRKWDEQYLTATYVDSAIDVAERERPSLLVVHLPDVDEAGHAYGGASREYARTVARVDADLGRLVQGLQDGHTVFVIVADHGHIDSGGHGGWEREVTKVSAVFAGPGVTITKGTGRSTDVAPTVAEIAGIGVPRYAAGTPLTAVARSADASAVAAARAQRQAFGDLFVRTVMPAPAPQPPGTAIAQPADAGSAEASSERQAADSRLAADRRGRVPIAVLGAVACLLVLALIGGYSWRALAAALLGTATYYLVYNGLFFGLHHYAWSLSAFNSEDRISAWMNGRLVDAALAGLVAAAAAAAVYPFLRKFPKGPHGEYLAGWLALGPTVILATLATLGLQVVWFVWAWGIDPSWRLPDLMWGFKYDLDLIQATALGFAAVLTPLVTYVVGRFHPRPLAIVALAPVQDEEDVFATPVNKE